MGDISLEQFLAHFKTLNLEVSMISCGVSILYRCYACSPARIHEHAGRHG
jgi:hypothetical protein